jgi:hypothetical protein
VPAIDDLLGNNQRYARTFTGGAPGRPSRALVVVAGGKLHEVG